MNSDDPKLTAYALDELDPAERTEIEQLLREDPAALAEVEETKTFVAQLRRELKAEAAAPLTEAQRAKLLAAANVMATHIAGHPERSAAEPKELAGLENADAPRRRSTIIPFPRPVVILWAAAACLVAAVSAGLLFPSIGVVKESARKSAAMSPLQVDRDLVDLPVPSSRAASEPVSAPVAPEPLMAASPTLTKPDERPGLVFENSGKLTASTDSPSFDLAPSKNPTSRPAPTSGEPSGLVAEATRFYDSGRYDLALKRSEQALALDPSGTEAKEMKSKVNDAIDAYGIASHDETRSAAVRNLEKAWNNPVRRFDPDAPSSEVGPARNPGKPAPAKIAGTMAGRAGEKSELLPYASAQPKPVQLASVAKNDRRAAAKQAEQLETPLPGGAPGFVTAGPLEKLYSSIFPLGTEVKDPRSGKSFVIGREDAGRTFGEIVQARGAGSTEAYDAITDNAFLAVRENPLSTFSIDVDTASYANVRRFLNQQTRPPKGAVRIEELLNYFTYDYPQPDGDAPFSATMEVATCPWTPEHRLVRIGLKGREIQADKRPATNLVFLIDVSGSMQPENKLPLLKKSLRLLVDKLTPEDTVAIAVYAGASGTVLEPTHDKRQMREALDRLESGGSTNGAAGIQLAYRLAERSFIKGGVNRVILATDGDFNVGVTSQSELTDLIERKAKTGTFLTVLGFGMGNLKDSTLEKLADKGNGNYAYIDTLNEARKVLVEQMSGTLVTIAKDVKIQVEFNPAQVGAYRLIGYENRLLAKEDFNDDKKDAGEIGAGHTVTALYEVVPAGAAMPGTPAVDPLKYQSEAKPEGRRRTVIKDQGDLSPGRDLLLGGGKSEASAELLTLKLRYKQPDGDTSKLLEFPLTDRGETWEKSSRDFRFAAAVAGFGMLLRESPHKGAATWESVRELAMEGRGEDRSGYRGEFLTLLDAAKAIMR